jgi:hypothetical protein
MYNKLPGIAIVVATITVLSFIIIYKAAIVPATFDEVSTYTSYTGFDKMADIILNTGGNTNNHILNSLSITLCQSVLGVKLWTLRLPNVLSYFLFCAAMLVLAWRYFGRSSLLFCMPFICMFSNPYLIDFFSLARGYGMGNAFMICSVVCLLLFSSTQKTKWYYYSILFAMLATYSNFTFLLYWPAVQLLLVGNLLVQQPGWEVKRVLVKTVLLTFAFAALCYAALGGMQQSFHDYFSGFVNFYTGVLLGDIDRFAYGKSFFGLSHQHIAWLVIAVMLSGVVNAILKIRRNRVSLFTDPFNLLLLLLLLVLVINVLQVYVANTNYPAYRAGLMYYVLFILVLVFLIRDVIEQNVWGAKILPGILVIVFAFHFACCVNLKSFYDWSYDAYTCDVMDYIDNYRHQHPEAKVVDLNLSNGFRNSFVFYTGTHHVPWLTILYPGNDSLQNNMADTSSESLFYYSGDKNVAALKNYKVVEKFRATGMPLPVNDPNSEQLLLINR